MKIHRIDVERENIPLTKPYAVAYESKDAIDLIFTRIETDAGHIGYGSGSPSAAVTGEEFDATFHALTDGRLTDFVGRDPRAIGGLIRELRTLLPNRPAATAAVEIALWDLFGKALDQPLVQVFGRHHRGLLTSVTIGIQPVEETLADAREHLANGFRCLKLKIGHELEVDVERIAKLRQLAGDEIPIRVDANQGYSRHDAIELFEQTRAYKIEFFEQPMKPAQDSELWELPDEMRAAVAAD
ncbi:MAG: enolase C-terminal domain-like protein, partial [Myxococcota bacterium]